MERDYYSDGRFSPEGNKNYHIEQLWETQQEILRLLATGMKGTVVAKELGITPQTVSHVRNSAIGRMMLARLTNARDEEASNIAQRLQKFKAIAMDLLEDVVKGDYEEASLHLRVSTAKHVLAMGGHGPVHKVASLSGSLTKEEMDALKQKAHETAKDLGVMVDVTEYKEVD